jgi:hypothetical protein
VIPAYTLTVEKAGAGSGTVTSSPSGISCDAGCAQEAYDYDEDTEVSLTASPADGSTFGGWSGGGCSGTGQCTVTMDSDISCTATFDDI